MGHPRKCWGNPKWLNMTNTRTHPRDTHTDAGSSENDARKHNTHTHTMTRAQVAWPSKWVNIAGLLVVGLGAGMQLLQLAPRVLRDIAADNIVPILYVCVCGLLT